MRAYLAAPLLTVSFWAPAIQAQTPHFSWVKGSVTVHDAAGATAKAVAGAPLAVGDRISLGLAGHAIIQVDAANLLDVADGADLRVTRVEKDSFAARIVSGMVTHSLTDGSSTAIELETPSVSVRPVQPGAYEVTITRFGATEVVPAGGAVEVFAQSGSQWVSPGQKMIARGDPANPEFRIVNAIPRWRRLLARLGTINLQASASSGGDAHTDRQRVQRPPLKPAANHPDPPHPPVHEGPRPSAPVHTESHTEAAKSAPAASSASSTSHGK